MQLINGALFLKTNFFLSNELLFGSLVAVALASVLLGLLKSSAVNVFLLTVIFHFTTMYASLKSNRSDLTTGVLILISLLTL